VDGSVTGLAVQADGKVLIGGTFTTLGGVARNYVARLNADGSLDTGFNPNVDSWVNGLVVQANGKVLILGQFTTVGGVARHGIARLANDPATHNLTIPDPTRVLWSRGGSASEVGDVVFEQSLDGGVTWTLLGAGVRIGVSSDWQRTGLSLGAGVKVRATGRTSGGGSSGLIRQVYPITLADVGATLTAAVISGSAGAPAMALGGTITADGGEIIERGFVYAVTATDSDPQIGDPGVVKLPVGGTTGSFSGVATGLSADTTYSYRSYARNSAGTVYSVVGTFTPAVPKPDLSIGADPTAATGAEEYSPVIQSVALLSRRGATVKLFAKVANEGLLPDAMRLRGSSGDNFFAVSYATAEGNVTAAVIAGSFATPVLSQDDSPVNLTVSVSPNKRLLTKKVKKGKRALTTTLRKTYSGFIEATATDDPTRSDAVRYKVTTTP
jgi:hypothetical protein